MQRTYTTPDGEVYTLFRRMLEQPHILIAGTTGSGKSVVLNGLISTALYRSPDSVGFVLIDPKRVELADYAFLPHTIAHAGGFDPEKWLSALQTAVNIMDARYTDMERRGLRMYDGSDIYVIIDEWANVYMSGGRDCFKAVLRLVSEGRAARVHLLLCTQIPNVKIIPSEVRENFPARVCLRTNTAVQSRVLMDKAGCEALPRFGYGYYVTPEGTDLYSLPMVSDEERRRLIDYWMKQTRPRLRLFGR